MAAKKNTAKPKPTKRAELAAFVGEWVFDPAGGSAKKRVKTDRDKAFVIDDAGKVEELHGYLHQPGVGRRSAKGKLVDDALHVRFKGARSPLVLEAHGKHLSFQADDIEHGKKQTVRCWPVKPGTFEAEVAKRQNAEAKRGERKHAVITAGASNVTAPTKILSPTAKDLEGPMFFIANDESFEIASPTLTPIWSSDWKIPRWLLELSNRPYKQGDDKMLGLILRVGPLGVPTAPVFVSKSASEKISLAKPKNRKPKIMSCDAWVPDAKGRATVSLESAIALRMSDFDVKSWTGKPGWGGTAKVEVYADVWRSVAPIRRATIRARLDAKIRYLSEPRFK